MRRMILGIVLAVVVMAAIGFVAIPVWAQSDAGFLDGPNNGCWWGYWTGSEWGEGTFVPLQWFASCPG